MTKRMLPEELAPVIEEVRRERPPLGRMPLRGWTRLAVWILRLYVIVMLILVGMKFLQMAGTLG